MNIAVNTRWLIPEKLEGFGWYTYHILKTLSHDLPHAQFHLLYDRKISAPLLEGLNIHNHIVYPPARHPILWNLWNNYSIPLALRAIAPDIYFSPDGFLPARLPVPSVVTIHDLNFEEDDHYLKRSVSSYYKKHIRRAAERANHIFTVSEFSRQDIIGRYGIEPNRISEAHNGPQEVFADLHVLAQGTQQRYARTHAYLLFVGAQNPRKNLQRIFKAFDDFVEKRKTDHRLVLVGEKMLWDEEINTAFNTMKHQERVLFTGRLSTKELNKVYSGATALVFPSLNEGFGMPIIEAFSAGCPVITSLSTAMPEVAGDAAILVDPTSTDEMVSAMEKMALDETERESYRQKGFERAKLFSWQKPVDQIRDVIEKLTHA